MKSSSIIRLVISAIVVISTLVGYFFFTLTPVVHALTLLVNVAVCYWAARSSFSPKKQEGDVGEDEVDERRLLLDAH